MYHLNRNIDILIFVEHKDRELETAILLSVFLENYHGLSTAVVSSIYHPLTSALLIRPKIVVTPSTAFGKGSSGWLFHKVFGNKCLFINMNYEQFISSWKGKYKSAKHSVSLNLQIQYTWGEYFKKFLIETGTKRENIIVTGKPTDTTLKLKYLNKNYKSELAKELRIDSNKQWIFLGLTDGLAFISETKKENIISSGAEKTGFLQHIEIVKTSIDTIIEWINKSKIDNYFIWRPHPSISVEQYEELIKKKLGYLPSNLIFTKKHTAIKWISSCDVFLTNYSTLALDSKLLKKDFFIIQPSKIKGNGKEDYWWCNNGKLITTFVEFESVLNSNYNLKSFKGKTKINDYIDYTKDGVLEMSQDISKRIKTISKYPEVNYLAFFISFLSAFKRLFGSIIRLFFVKLKINPFGIVKKGIIDDYFSRREFEKVKRTLTTLINKTK